MKQNIITLLLLACFCLPAFGEFTIKTYSTTNLGDTTVTSTMDSSDFWTEDDDEGNRNTDMSFFSEAQGILKTVLILPIIGVIFSIGLPAFIIFIILWFRHKNKQAKFKLASEALAAGKEVPHELFKEDVSTSTQNNGILTRGIKNICLGIGLGVLLWTLTEVTGIAAIGFLIFCMGVGQVVIAYATRSHSQENKHNNLPKEQE